MENGEKMKKLKKFFKNKGFSQNGFARELGIGESVFSLYLNRKRKFPLELAVAIEKISKGEVKCKDLI